MASLSHAERSGETSPLLPASSSQQSGSRRRRQGKDRFRSYWPSENPKKLLRGLLALLGVLFAALLILLFLYSGQSADPDEPRLDDRGRLNPPNLIKGRQGAVATENRVCSEVGTALLKDGGSAADAAVGATLCVGVLNMFSSGIGGGGFALVRAPSQNGSAAETEHTVVDFRETAPAGAFEEMFHDDPTKAKVGGLAVGVPGELRGLEEIWTRWGKLPWHRVVEPSISLAREARVGKELARRLKFFGGFIPERSEWEEIFLDPVTGHFLEEGDLIRRPAYARTLEAVANNGSDAFYHGPIAEAMVQKVQSAHGILTMQDLADYKIEMRQALSGTWIGKKRVWTTPAPTGGPVLLAMLNLLQLLDFESESHHRKSHPLQINPSHRALWAHRLIEVFKHGYAARTRLADPRFVNETWLGEIAKIPSMSRAQQILPKINDSTTFGIDYYEPIFDTVEDHGTTHISAVDSDGMSVGITSTVNLIFGSQVLDPETGVIFNDQMDDSSTPGTPNAFGLYPSPFNYPQPGKRPLSSISPIIIEDEHGRFETLLGAAGGSRIPTSVLSSVLNLELGMDLSEAIEAPRLHHQLLPPIVGAESTFDSEALRGLMARGHQVMTTDINLGFTSVQGVQRDHRTGRVKASSDSRKAGWAAAY
ncbi:unnamed protein product [Parajaminaea phylloscopi]